LGSSDSVHQSLLILSLFYPFHYYSIVGEGFINSAHSNMVQLSQCIQGCLGRNVQQPHIYCDDQSRRMPEKAKCLTYPVCSVHRDSQKNRLGSLWTKSS